MIRAANVLSDWCDRSEVGWDSSRGATDITVLSVRRLGRPRCYAVVRRHGTVSPATIDLYASRKAAMRGAR